MKKMVLFVLMLGLGTSSFAAFRAPAVPLVTVDPFFSVWSAADKLTDCETSHWTGKSQPMCLQIEVDGERYRLMGREPSNIPALPQTSCSIRPTQTIYQFENQKLEAELRFSTPLIPDDLDVFSRPVTYVTFRAQLKNGKSGQIRFTYGLNGSMVTDRDDAIVIASENKGAFGTALSIGRQKQAPLSKSGDMIRCGWGYAWISIPGEVDVTYSKKPLPAKEQKISVTQSITASPAAELHLLLAYDDISSIQFMHKNLPAWWRRNGLTFPQMLENAEKDYTKLLSKMDAFDQELTQDLTQIGGGKYAQIAALAYRQSFAACKLVADENLQPLYFSKENASNGCIGTVDVLYPQFPHLLLMSPTLARATLAPMLLYASSPRWKFPFAPHDLGRYPLANGQVYGGGEKDVTNQMPVEECGNMLICLGALSHLEGNADFASGWWKTITQWAEYLGEKGFDPENQLCTDDFAGHLAHNANLSIKAIMGLACYAKMAEMRGEKETASRYLKQAKDMVGKWTESAKGGKFGSYKLAFDKPDSWSMKYNLVWDQILGFHLFPKEVARTEMAAYRKLLQPYGLPLDNRKTWTKSDWLVWTAALTQNRADFDVLINSLYRFVNETPDRIPFTDWYWTENAKHRGFIARSVIGGVFIPALYDQKLWTKYCSRDHEKTKIYAPIQTAQNGKPTAAFRLATFNIRYKNKHDPQNLSWENRAPLCVRLVLERNFDIFGAQEVRPEQIADMRKGLGPNWEKIGLGREKDLGGEASCIFYKKNRFKVLREDTFWLAENTRKPGLKSWGAACPRICTWGEFLDLKTGRRFFLFNTHLDHVSNVARIKGANLITRKMLEVAQGAPVFLTGDFNSKPGSAPILHFSNYLFDTIERSGAPHKGPINTFHSFGQKHIARLDYIFASGDVKVLSHETCTERYNGIFPSDHDPVFIQAVLD